jgi:N-acetylneuraminate synthase
MQKKFPIGRYEFHLSFGEVLSAIDVKRYDSTARYSIHLPDYVSSTLLMDPFSEDETQRAASADILERTVALAAALQERTGADVPVVGSFSVVHGSRKEFFEAHAQLLWKYRRQGVSVLPQWLPPIAWYFGGSVRLHAMNSREDAELIEHYQLPICMDICHLCMGECTSDFVAVDVLRRLRPHIRHLHIADAMGIDGEGMLFGDGDPKNMATLREAMRFDQDKVVEVWQGHLDGGAGFAKSLMRLRELFDDSH